MTTAGGPSVSVVVPALDEAGEIEASLDSALAGHPKDVVVVDGGSQDDTGARAYERGARVLTSTPGRSTQMNLGAAQTDGAILLFLHADTRLPPGWIHLVTAAIAAGAVAGRFDVVLRGTHPILPLVAAGMNLRSRLSRIYTGDQAIFVRRDVFERIGGYEAIPLMEDIDLSRRLKREGAIACLRAQVSTSGRRWETHGAVRTVLLMHALRFAYFVGVAPERLARLYRRGP